MPIDTHLDGRPGDLRAVASWLRGEFRSSLDTLATDSYRARSTMSDAWQGEGGTAFHGRVTTLASATDEVASSAGSSASTVDGLAASLDHALDGMTAARAKARGAGLEVDGFLIMEPDPVPSATPPVDPTPAEAADHEAAVAAVKRYNELVAAYDAVAADVQGYLDDWRSATESAVDSWNSQDANLVGVAGNFITTGVTTPLLMKVSSVLAGEAAEQLKLASQLADHADALTPNGVLLGDRAHYYGLLDDAKLAEARAAQAAAAAEDPKLPKGITRAGGILGVLTTGYGIHSDLEDGESTEQAVASNVGGMVAGIAAGAGTGAAVGAAVGSVVPGAGTAVGAVAGTVIGTGVGIVTSGAIDSMYENGVESIGDVGDAIVDGGEELVDTGEAIVDIGEDVIGAIL